MIKLTTDYIKVEIEQRIAWLILNNPERHNAINLAMWQGIGDALEQLQQEDDIRVVILRGAGDKAFASGADISEFDQHRANAEQREQYGKISRRGSYWLAHFAKPLLAMAHGYCIGGGLAVALNADIRFASTQATFAIPAAKLGLGYEYQGIAKLARLVGPSATRDILFSARRLDAAEALTLGLINFVYPPEQLEAKVREYAATIAANAPLTIRAAKQAVNLFEKQVQDEATQEILESVEACFDSEDYKEGRLAFKEKRPPKFIGK